MAEEQNAGGPPEKDAPAKPPAPAQPAPRPAPKPPAAMVTAPWDSELSRKLKEKFGESVLEAATYVGQNFAVVKPEAVVPVLDWLKMAAGFDYLVDVTAVDWPKRVDRFDLVYIIYSFARNERVRVKTSIPDGFRPLTAVHVHATANWLEREVFDMFGIEFAGHPDLRRILLPEGWTGHPLRKDHPLLQQDRAWVQDNLGIDSGQ